MDPKFVSPSPLEERNAGQTNQHNTSAGGIARLVSKFEGLDTRRLPYRHRRSNTLAKADSCFNLYLQPETHHGADLGYEDGFSHRKTCQDQSKTTSDLARVSLGHAASAVKSSIKIKRSQSLKAKPSATVSTLDLGPRHKSVAERRRIFEVNDDNCAPKIPPKLSSCTHSPLKSAQVLGSVAVSSRNLGPRISVSGDEYPLDVSPTSQLGPQMPRPQRETRHVQTTSTDVPQFQFETPPEYSVVTMEAAIEHTSEFRPNDQVSDVPCNVMRTPPCKPRDFHWGPHTDPLGAKGQTTITKSPGYRSLKSKSPSIGGSRNQKWLENAQRMAFSLSASASNRESVTDGQIMRRPKGFRPGLKKLQQPTSIEIDATIGPVTSESNSKISSLRRKFDTPKSSTTPMLPSISRRRGKTTPVESLRCEPLILRKSMTAIGPNNLNSPRRSVQDAGAQPDISLLNTSVPTRTSWSNDKSESPLKEKIGIFEALGHKDSDHDEVMHHAARGCSGKGRARGMKGALRRISATFRKSSSEWSTTSPQDPYVHCHGDLVEECSAFKHQGLVTSSSYHEPRRGTEPLRRELYTKNTKETPETSISASKGYNVNGEGGLHFHSFSSPGPVRIGHADTGQKKHSPPSTNRHTWLHGSTITEAIQVNPVNIRRRIMSRSKSPFVSKAHCSLEQPMPVRANELKRLVSLCKSKMMRRLSNGDGL